MVAALTTDKQFQQILSASLAHREAGLQDLVSNSNVLFKLLKDKKCWKEFSGPMIRERLLYNKTGATAWYDGYDTLPNPPAELLNDASFYPKMVAQGISYNGKEVLENSGRAQLIDLVKTKIEAAEKELVDDFDIALHGDGTRYGGKELTGLRAAVPTLPNVGTYGGINRATNASWRTKSYDMQTAFPTMGTNLTKANISNVLSKMIIDTTRGKKSPDLLLMSQEYYMAFQGALENIQTIANENELGKLGFSALKYYGAGKSCDVVLEGGIGSNMPANTIYGLHLESLALRYHKDRNFSKISDEMQSINQDAKSLYIGFFGELILKNPMHTFKLYDSNPAT